MGAAIWPGHSYYSSKDTVTGRFKPHKLKGEEVAHIDQARRNNGFIFVCWHRRMATHHVVMSL